MPLRSPLQVCIVGAGAIGCTLAARLAGAGHTVNVLARGRTLEAIRRHGIVLHDLDGKHNAKVHADSDCAALGEQDVVFLCTKAHALNELAPTLHPLLGPDTVVVPMINGVPWWYFHGEGGRFANRSIRAVDPDGRIGAALAPQRILGCVVFMTAETQSPGVAHSDNRHRMILGEPDNRLSDRLESVRALIDSAGIEVRASDRIRDALWTKIIANLTSNPLSVLTGATLAQIYGHPELTPLVRKVLDEALLTAASYGAQVGYDPQSLMEMGANMGDVRTSMLQDHELGRPLELAAIGDAVVELAELQGVNVPVTRDLLNLVRFRDRVRVSGADAERD